MKFYHLAKELLILIIAKKDKMLVETTIKVKCKSIVNESLDNVFIQYCGKYENDEN
jgi:hypothetical protein